MKFKSLRVYNLAYTYAIQVIKEIEYLNNDRIKDQLFGSTTSVPANLAECGGFKTNPYIKNKLRICIGECNETEFWLDLCHDLKLLPEEKISSLKSTNENIRVMLCSLYKKFQPTQRDSLSLKMQKDMMET